MPLISVIMPIYNVEKYIKTSVDSILNQSFRDFELILIDDGSTDNSGELCDKYAAKDSRVRVFHIKNNGVSNARNVGLRHANGQYVYFCDGDDYIDDNAFQVMSDILRKYSIDLLIFGYYFEAHKVDKNGRLYIDRYSASFDYNSLYSSKEDIKKDLVNMWNKSLMYNVWNKLYRLDIIRNQNIEFSTKLTMGEDLDFSNKYFVYCNSFYVLSDCFYHYIRERENSATTRFIDGWFKIRVEEHERLLNFFHSCGILDVEGKEFLSRRFIERTIGCIENEFNNKNAIGAVEKRRHIKQMINHQYTRESLKYVKYTSKKMAIMVLPIKIKSVSLTCIEGMFISFIRRKLPHIFIKLKQRR